jgi:L-iditol 2-dehydrogenase
MKALVLEDYKKFTLVNDYDEPALAPNEVLVQVRSCGICGSDVHGYDGSSGRRIPPVIMGHEASGVVAKTGSAVTRFREGDRVTFDSMISCGLCYFCRHGRPNLCDNRRVLGVSCGEYRRNGAFAEFVNVPEHIVYPIPDGLSFDHAAMVEPVSVAVHAVDITPIRLGDTALVLGAGMIGLLTLQALRTAGCGRIIIADLADDRLELAKNLGADDAVNSGNSDVVEFVKQATGGRGADVALEAVGATPTIKLCVDAVRKGGSVTLIGNITPQIELGLQAVVTREISLFGSCASANDYPACLELMARGAIQVAPMISATGPLESGPDFFTRLYNREPNLTKVILNP